MKTVLALIPSLAFNALFVLLVLIIFVKADFSSGFIFLSAYYLRMLSFTFLQAFGGALLSLFLALFLLPTVQKLPHSLFGKSVRYLLSIPFFLPSIVGCVALIGLFGQGGFVASLCKTFNIPYTTFLYGIFGILLCHIFYYTPFILQAFEKPLSFLPGEAKRLSYTLGMGSFSQLRFLYYPLLKAEIPAIFSLVFMYCLRSFTTVLIFGGTPQNTTIEVGIFQALNFDLDWQTAAQLSLAQLSVAIFISYLSKSNPQPTKILPEFQAFNFKKFGAVDGLAFFIIFLLFFLTLFSIFVKGAPCFWLLCFEVKLWKSLLNSLVIGFLSFIFTLFFVAPLVYTAYKFTAFKRPNLSFFAGELPSKLSLLFSPLLIAFLFYALLGSFFETYSGFLLTISLVNAVAFAPSVYQILASSYRFQRKKYDQLCAQLNISGLWRLLYLDFRDFKKALGYAWALCMIFAIGDSRVIFLFNKGYFSSLTIYLYDKMRAYEFAQAASIALFMIVFSALILWVSEKIFGKYQ